MMCSLESLELVLVLSKAYLSAGFDLMTSSRFALCMSQGYKALALRLLNELSSNRATKIFCSFTRHS